MSDTPRTDEAYWRTDKGCNTCVPADFARDLERENARLREALEERQAMSDTPRTDAIRRKWSAAGGGKNTCDASPEAKELYEHADQLERELAEAKRLICPGNGDYPNPVRCQSFEASEQNEPCPPGCCVMAKEEDVRMILAAIESEDG